ncbi:MAG TPA: hypothetical protein VFA65_07450 [Bryobacteraceae bacterium]|nr:hypothetical protein [Bryobacteraceae bacterium]
MKYLVDASILSEPTKPSPDLRVVNWLRAHEHPYRAPYDGNAKLAYLVPERENDSWNTQAVNSDRVTARYLRVGLRRKVA